jgi:hypothetical protein
MIDSNLTADVKMVIRPIAKLSEEAVQLRLVHRP